MIRLFTETIVLVSDMELYRDIAKRRPRVFSRLDFPNVSGEDALPFLEGDTWKKKRRIVARPLTDKNVESFLPMICSVAKSLVEHVRCRADRDGTIARWEPEEDLRLCASKVAAALCMGDADPLASESPLYQDDFLNNAVQLTTQELEIGLHPMDVPILHNPLLRLFSPTLQKFWKDSKRLMTSLRDIMASRTGIDKAGRFPSIVDNAGEDLSLHGSAIILKTFIAAGTETTAHFTAKLLKRLCLNPRAQERARDEVLKLEHDPESYEELQQLPFLHACILETLRLDLLGPVLPIRALTNCVLADKPIAAGTRVLIMHKKILERSCDRGTEFRPVRWLTPDETDIDQAMWSKFVAFGYGPRQCPGKHLAMKEMIVFAAYLLRYFDNIRLGEGCKIEDKYTTFLGMHQKDFYVAMDAGRKAAMWGTDPRKPF
ncbi:hypothetical protein FOZ63_028039 [Perkinsus olseni]|uniref:Cytochrome P450 n=1 Tax=Perkinsus olseni TaxID=32597 RepID=A0A7J6QDP8_PEROL|nr:hypothetical protein FOZ63_028039 [Perkinsus olseni]